MEQDDVPLETFWGTLSNYADAVDPTRVVTTRSFGSDVGRLVAAYPRVGSSTEVVPGTVVVATLDHARGARARHLIVANLAEGSFPTREAVESSHPTTRGDRAWRTPER